MAALVVIWSARLGSHIAVRTAGMSDDPRYAAFAREWGPDSPRPPLEQQMLRSRGERCRDYQARTSTFFPLPQKGVVT